MLPSEEPARPSGFRRRRIGQCRGRGSWPDRIGVHGPRDVLELLLAQILEREIELAGDILLHARRNTQAARLRQAFEASGNVDAVAEDVAVFDDDVAHMDADAPLDAAFWNRRRVALGHLRLHLAGAT